MPVAQNLRSHVFSRQREDEGQEQACGSSSWNHQRVDSASGRENKRVSQCVSSRVCEKVGCLAKHVHARLWRPLQGALLLDADHRGRTYR